MGELFCPCPELLHLRLLEGKREEGRKRLFPKDPLRGRMGGRRAGGGRRPRAGAAGSRCLQAASGLLLPGRVRLEFCSSDVTRRRAGKLPASPFGIKPGCPQSQPLPLRCGGQRGERAQTRQQPRTRGPDRNSVPRALCAQLLTFGCVSSFNLPTAAPSFCRQRNSSGLLLPPIPSLFFLPVTAHQSGCDPWGCRHRSLCATGKSPQKKILRS